MHDIPGSESHQSADARVRGGFTLIELLVVVMIICILLAMLFPVLNLVRSAARTTVCQSNMRQIYVGLIGYTNDWNGCMPHILNYDPQPGSYHWGAWGETWGTTIAVFLNCRTGGYPGGVPAEGPNLASISTLNIFRCPENQAQQYQMGTGGGEFCTSYTGNGFGTLEQTFNCPWTSRVFAQEKFIRLQHISELMCFWDGSYYGSGPQGNDGARSIPFTSVGAQWVRYCHHGRSNIMYVDGHIGGSTLIQSCGSQVNGSVTTPMRASDWTNGRPWYGLD
jgi:prepilin-type N-terminal cleavage/methylation domain-containing protein/prepilin-type processing-associated H-X9-DG protein